MDNDFGYVILGLVGILINVLAIVLPAEIPALALVNAGCIAYIAFLLGRMYER